MNLSLYSNTGLVVRLVGAATFLIIGLILGRLASNLIKRLLGEISFDRALKKKGIKFVFPGVLNSECFIP